jgi:hypothetical protein
VHRTPVDGWASPIDAGHGLRDDDRQVCAKAQKGTQTGPPGGLGSSAGRASRGRHDRFERLQEARMDRSVQRAIALARDEGSPGTASARVRRRVSRCDGSCIATAAGRSCRDGTAALVRQAAPGSV